MKYPRPGKQPKSWLRVSLKIMDIRKATIEDSAAIARNVMAAMGYDVFSETVDDGIRVMMDGMAEICAREDTLYSWRNTLVACVEGEFAGSLTSYDGGDYLRMREVTFGLAHEKFGWTPPMMDDETRAGEWYLDSLAVLPAFRRRGLAQLLVSQMFEVAEALGFAKVSLIVLASSDRLIAHYESFGFRPDGHLDCFGHDYLRMIAEI